MGRKKRPPEGAEGLAVKAPTGGKKGRGIESLPLRLNKYQRHKDKSISVAEFVRPLVEDHDCQRELRMVGRLEKCGSYLVFRNYFTIDQLKLAKANFCKNHFLCEFCASLRAGKQIRQYLDRLKVIKSENSHLRQSLFTPTVKNGDDLRERFAHLSRGVKLLNQRRRSSKRDGTTRSEWSKVLGYVGSYEVTNKGNGWHPHAHIVLLHEKDIDQDHLVEEWQEITGDSFILNVKLMENQDDPVKDFCEVFKYALKFSDLSLWQQWEAYQILRGRRLVYSGGLFRGVKVPEDLADDLLAEDLPYIDLLFRYVRGQGYSFASSDTGKGGRPNMGRLMVKARKGKENENRKRKFERNKNEV